MGTAKELRKQFESISGKGTEIPGFIDEPITFTQSYVRWLENKVIASQSQLSDELLEIFKAELIKYPEESVRECWDLALGWYELRDFKNDPFPEGGLKL